MITGPDRVPSAIPAAGLRCRAEIGPLAVRVYTGDMPQINDLVERAKELRCMYEVNAAVSDRAAAPAAVFLRVLSVVPDGWQRPETAGARIQYLGRSYVGPGFTDLGASIRAPLRLFNVEVGHIEVSDTALVEPAVPTFLPEEQELLNTIAMRIGEYLEWKHTQLLGERLSVAGEPWRWRQTYVEALVAALDRERFGVGRVFLGGSTESGEAGPGSDVDLYVEHFGSSEQRSDLGLWLDGWSRCLAELAYQQTGYRFPGGLLDVHFLDATRTFRIASELREVGV